MVSGSVAQPATNGAASVVTASIRRACVQSAVVARSERRGILHIPGPRDHPSSFVGGHAVRVLIQVRARGARRGSSVAAAQEGSEPFDLCVLRERRRRMPLEELRKQADGAPILPIARGGERGLHEPILVRQGTRILDAARSAPVFLAERRARRLALRRWGVFRLRR